MVLDSARRLELFTSGSSGERKAIIKTLGQLEREVSVLEETFGKSLGACEAYATVSHQHIYGLLFRLLWPLCAARPFADDTFLLWDELASRLSKDSAFYLVASPTHLERVGPAGIRALRAGRIRALFSSGGPLNPTAAAWMNKTCEVSPIEVFGSTETGGVGWRRWSGASAVEAWTPLKGVTISENQGRLRVASPFVSSPRGWILMDDQGSVSLEGRFQLGRRIDRVVKSRRNVCRWRIWSGGWNAIPR